MYQRSTITTCTVIEMESEQSVSVLVLCIEVEEEIEEGLVGGQGRLELEVVGIEKGEQVLGQ